MHRISIFFALLILSSCQKNSFFIENRYVCQEDLASYYVDTPDPSKYCPDIGQKLLISWDLSCQEMQATEITLHLLIRYRNQTEDSLVIMIEKSKGSYTFELLNDDYIEKAGILTYRAEIDADGVIIKEWKHQLWTELILFDKSD